MPNNVTSIMTALAAGASIVKAKGVGYIVLQPTKTRRKRRTLKAHKKTAAA